MIKNSPPESYACVFVRDIAVDVRIGLYEHEKKAPQRLKVSVEVYTDAAYLRKAEEAFIDYEKIFSFVQGWRGNNHVELIETYVHETLDYVFGFKEVHTARVSIAKPDIFNDADAVGVEVFVTRKEFEKL